MKDERNEKEVRRQDKEGKDSGGGDEREER